MGQNGFVDLYTLEGEQLSGLPWNIHPRPQMRRESFLNLNGMWEFSIVSGDEEPEQYEEQIQVPFPPQSLLSGVHRECPEEQRLFYRKHFEFSVQ